MELIEKRPKQRVYKLDFRVYLGNPNGRKITIEDIFKADPFRFMPDWELLEITALQYVDKVCVSDANDFIERLVFPAFMIKNIKTGEEKLSWRTNTIAGSNTMSIHGGNPDLVWEDKVYIRHLRMLNAEYNKVATNE